MYKIIVAALILFSVSACSGGGSGSGSNNSDGSIPPAAPVTISGTAATGIAIDGVVNVYGSNGGSILGVPVSATGIYSVDVTGLTAPYLISAVPTNSSLPSHYSYAANPGTANITPMTTLALFYANGSQDPAALINTWPASKSSVVSSLPGAQATVNANFVGVFDDINTDLNIDFSTYDFFTTEFDIGDIFDQILDLLNIDLSGGTPVITIDGSVLPFDPNIDISGINIGGSAGGQGGLGTVFITGVDTSAIGSSFSPITESNSTGMITAIAWGNLEGQITVAGTANRLSVITFNITKVVAGQIVHYSYALKCALPGNDCSKLQLNMVSKQAFLNNLVMPLSGAVNNQAAGPVTLNGTLNWN